MPNETIGPQGRYNCKLCASFDVPAEHRILTRGRMGLDSAASYMIPSWAE